MRFEISISMVRMHSAMRLFKPNRVLFAVKHSTFVGSSLTTNSVVGVNGADASYLPGNAAGLVAAGGQYEQALQSIRLTLDRRRR